MAGRQNISGHVSALCGHAQALQRACLGDTLMGHSVPPFRTGALASLSRRRADDGAGDEVDVGTRGPHCERYLRTNAYRSICDAFGVQLRACMRIWNVISTGASRHWQLRAGGLRNCYRSHSCVAKLLAAWAIHQGVPTSPHRE